LAAFALGHRRRLAAKLAIAMTTSQRGGGGSRGELTHEQLHAAAAELGVAQSVTLDAAQKRLEREVQAIWAREPCGERNSLQVSCDQQQL
jgi:hypothetical protein